MDLKRFINTTFSSYISIHVPLPYTGRLCRFTLPASLVVVYGQTFSTLALSSFRTIWWIQISKRLEMVREILLSTLDSKPLLVWFGWKETYQKRISTVYCSGLLVIKAVYLDGFGRMRLVVPLLLFSFHGLKEVADKTWTQLLFPWCEVIQNTRIALAPYQAKIPISSHQTML